MDCVSKKVEKRGSMKFYVGITEHQKIVFGPIIVLLKWDGCGDDKEERIIFPDRINTDGWCRTMSSVVQFLASKKQYDLKLKEEDIELVLPVVVVPYSFSYKVSYIYHSKELKEVKKSAEEKRLWLIDKVYADAYPQYDLRKNKGRLRGSFVLKILKEGINDLFIEKRLSKLGIMLENEMKEMRYEAMFSDYNRKRVPVWWRKIFPNYEFCRNTHLMDGTKYPEEFIEWVKKYGIYITAPTPYKAKKEKEKEKENNPIAWERDYFKGREPFLDRRQTYKAMLVRKKEDIETYD